MKPASLVKGKVAAPVVGLSERAKSSFDALLRQSWAASMRAEGDSVSAEIVASLPPKMKEKHAVVLTIASYSARIVVAMYFKFDAETRNHFERLNRAEAGSFDEQRLIDALNECGNICAGALNRSLGEVFPHIGMSTPNLLSRDAMAYVEALGPCHGRHYELKGLSQPYWASLYVRAYAPLDFHVDVPSEAEAAADTGELEMF